MRTLVTGSAGFIGQNLVDELLSRGHEVVGYDNAKPKWPAAASVTVLGSLLDRNLLGATIARTKPDVVFHLGARTDLHGRSVADYAANTVGTKTLIECIGDHAAAAHTIYSSSRLVFAIEHRPRSEFDYKPSTAYGESKIQMERIVREGASAVGTWTLVRPTSIWGPGFSTPYRNFFDEVERGRFVKVRGTNPLKSFGYVKNSVHQLITLALADRHLTHERVLWLTDYDPTFVHEWADEIADAFGTRRPRSIPRLPISAAAKIGSAAQAVLKRDMPLTQFRLNNLLTDVVFDSSETEQIVGDLPYTRSSGVRETVDWLATQRSDSSG